MAVTNKSGTLPLLRSLRQQRIVVLHPDDADGQELIAQCQRIGCHVRAYWPPPKQLPDDAGFVFFAMRPEILTLNYAPLGRPGAPPAIAVITSEDPTTVDFVLRFNAHAVVASPVKSFGLLSAMAVALHIANRASERERYVQKLERRLASQRMVDKAKAILMQLRGVSEEEAYRLIRKQAMAGRTTTHDIAEGIIKTNELLGDAPKAPPLKAVPRRSEN